jgi:hypothetical protein
MTARARRRAWVFAGGVVGLLLAVAGTLDYRVLNRAWPWSADQGDGQADGPLAALDDGVYRTNIGRVAFLGRSQSTCPAMRGGFGQAMTDLERLARTRVYIVKAGRDERRAMIWLLTAAFDGRCDGLAAGGAWRFGVVSGDRGRYVIDGGGGRGAATLRKPAA